MVNFTKVQNTTYISGDSGKYDGKVQNPSVRYGRNSLDNFKEYIKAFNQPVVLPDTFELKDTKGDKKLAIENADKTIENAENFLDELNKKDTNTPTINYVRQYMPNGVSINKIDKMALLANAYEEMGEISIDTDELTSKFNNPMMTAEALDINKDGKVDISKYSTSFLLADSLDNPNHEIDGKLTNQGEDANLVMSLKHNKDIAYKAYSYLYNFYNLGEAKEEFIGNPNNMM